MHYYKKNIGDYHKRAGRLNMLQHGAYTLLIDCCYDREDFPTLDEAIDWVWASTTEEVEAVKFVLGKFFELSGGVYIHKDIEKGLDNYQKSSAINKRVAIEREEKRKREKAELEENNTNRERTVNEALTDSEGSVNESTPNQEPLTINQEPQTINQEPSKDTLSVKTDVDDSVLIFDYWKKVWNKNDSAKFNAKRKKSRQGSLERRIHGRSNKNGD